MSTVFKILKRVLIALVSLFIAAVIGFLAWRILSSGNPSSMEALVANDKLVAAYEESDRSLYMYRQEQNSITRGDTNYGYFAITEYAIIPDANQVQTVIRYNNSTLKYTAADLGLSGIPAREAENYDFSLVVAIDLTPENKDDNLGNDPESVKFVRCHGALGATEQKNMYNFRRMVFDLDSAEINIKELKESGLLLAMYVDFYYIGNVNYEESPMATLCLYDYLSEDITVKLDRKDKKALEAYGDN